MIKVNDEVWWKGDGIVLTGIVRKLCDGQAVISMPGYSRRTIPVVRLSKTPLKINFKRKFNSFVNFKEL